MDFNRPPSSFSLLYAQSFFHDGHEFAGPSKYAIPNQKKRKQKKRAMSPKNKRRQSDKGTPTHTAFFFREDEPSPPPQHWRSNSEQYRPHYVQSQHVPHHPQPQYYNYGPPISISGSGSIATKPLPAPCEPDLIQHRPSQEIMDVEQEVKTDSEPQDIKKGNWEEAEDDKLVRILTKYQHTDPKTWNWPAISVQMGNRTAKQCRERWKCCLSPEINHCCWTFKEDMFLWDMQEKVGNHWAEIASHMPGRTENSVKTRFKSIKRASLRFWTPDEDIMLINFRYAFGSDWERIAEKLPGRTKNGVKMRYKKLKNGTVHQNPEPGAPTQILRALYEKKQYEEAMNEEKLSSSSVHVAEVITPIFH